MGPPMSARSNLLVAVCISTRRLTQSTIAADSLFTASAPEKVSPSWIAPNEDGSVKRVDAFVRSRRVFGWPGSGVLPWRECTEAVEWAEKEGELE